MIDLKTSIMTMKHDKSKQYSIKRMENVPKRLRQERFCPIPEISSDMTSDRSFYYGIDRSKRHFTFSWQQEYFVDMQQSVEHAATGILIEGEKLGHRKEAQWIANHLLEVKYKSKQEIDECCITLYTRECFLYKLLNKTLRDDDLDKHETLGPFAYLLGYRIGKKELLHWKSFVSTTKNLAKAEFYESNTLLYISLLNKKNTTSAIYITTYSYIPDEEEVLLSPRFYFEVDSVKYDDEKKR